MGRGLRVSGLSELLQLDPPDRRQWRGRELLILLSVKERLGQKCVGLM